MLVFKSILWIECLVSYGVTECARYASCQGDNHFMRRDESLCAWDMCLRGAVPRVKTALQQRKDIILGYEIPYTGT